jgi:hypothetical protein
LILEPESDAEMGALLVSERCLFGRRNIVFATIFRREAFVTFGKLPEFVQTVTTANPLLTTACATSVPI